MKWKVCGMRDEKNIEEVAGLYPDYMGFVFYKQSPRYARHHLNKRQLHYGFPKQIKKVGVFVKESVENILDTSLEFDLQLVQLYECVPDDIKEIQKQGIKTICAFSMSSSFSFNQLDLFEHSDYYLFDNATKNYGGSGRAFNRDVLYRENVKKPYFMSGGVTLDEIRKISTSLFAIDVNSRFELEPGVKNVKQLSMLKSVINKPK